MSVPELVRLADCCEIVAGATPSTNVDSYWGGDIAWATPKDLSDLDGKYLSSTPDMLTEEGYKNCSAKLMPAGSVLFSSRAPIGHVAINSVPMCTNQGFKSFVPDPDRVSADYLYHWLKANKAYLQSLGNGATFKEVSKAVVSEIKVPLPPLPEQRRIAAILDKADALRARRREAIAKLDQLLQSVFLDMFGDPVTNPKRWPVRPLGQLCDVRDGTHDSPKYVAEGYPLVTSKNLSDGYVSLDGAMLISEVDYKQINKRSQVHKGDLLMPMIGTVGSPVLVDHEPSYAVKNVAILKFRDAEVSNHYVLHLLRSHYFDWVTSKRNRGGTQKFIALVDIRGMDVPNPPRGLQERFTSFVSNISVRTADAKNAEGKTDHLFSSLQTAAFSGGL